MPKNPNYMIVFLLFLFLFPRVCLPVPATAADKISKIKPHFLSTPQEPVTIAEPAVKKPRSKSWIYVLVGGVVLLAALAGGGGGGGGGDSGTEQSGGVSVNW